MRLFPILPALLLLAGCHGQPAEQQAPPTAAGPAPVATPAPAATAPAAKPAGSAATFNWSNDACTLTGTYDPNVHSRQQIAGTYQTAIGFGRLPSASAYRLADYTDARFQRLATRLEQTHDSLAAVLRGVAVVPTPFWRQLKQLRAQELAEQYEQGQLEVAAYRQPATLRQSRYYTAASAPYADALASADTAVVLRAWRQLIATQKKNNAFPEQFDREYAQYATTPEGLRFAKMQLLTFGWHNYVASQSRFSNLADQHQPLDKFAKLFQRIKESNCVDVD